MVEDDHMVRDYEAPNGYMYNHALEVGRRSPLEWSLEATSQRKTSGVMIATKNRLSGVS